MSGWEARLHVLGVVLIEGEDGPSVASVTDGGRAAASGQVSVGDVVLAVNDIRIDDKEPRDIERLGESVDHRGHCTLWLAKSDGSEAVVAFDLASAAAAPGAAGDSVGVGLTISTAVNDVPVVAELSAWGSARWSGKIGVGDEIVTVHGKQVSRMSPRKIVDLIDDSSLADGGIVKVGIRRKGMLPSTAPLQVLLARSLVKYDSKMQHHFVTPDIGLSAMTPPDSTRKKQHALVQRSAPIPSRGQLDGFGVSATQTEMYQSERCHDPDPLASLGLPRVEKQVGSPAQQEKTQTDMVLSFALQQLLDYVQDPVGKDGVLRAFDHASNAHNLSRDMISLTQIKDAVVAQQEEIAKASDLVTLLKQNMDKRKQHILTLSAQLKDAQETRHSHLKANNEWMQREVQKQREALEDERRSIQAQLQHDNDERMAQAERGLDEFRRKLEETLAAKYLSKLTALESTLEEFQREARSKVKCMEEMAVQELALKKDNERLSAENKSLKDKAAQLVQSFVAEAPSAQETDMRKRQDEQHEKDSLKAEIEALQCRLVEAQESSIMAAAQLQERNKRISALMEVNAALENQVQERQEHFDKIEGTLSELEKHAFEMRGKRMAQASESPELGSQVAGNFDQGGSEAVFDHVPEHDVAHTEASLATPTVYESKDQAAFVHGQHRSQAGAFVGGAEMWSIFIQEGRPVPGAPELFEFRKNKCNQPFYDENNICEIRNVVSGELYYRGLGIHGADHSSTRASS